MNYKGTIIEESLENTDVLKSLKITGTRVEGVTEKSQTPWLTKWTLHKVEILELEAETIAQIISQSIDTKHIGSWYADFQNDMKHYVIFRNKVFFLDKKNQEQYEEMRKYGLKVGVPEYQLKKYGDD
jgi:hypothetical protein